MKTLAAMVFGCLFLGAGAPVLAQHDTGKPASGTPFERKFRFRKVENCITSYRNYASLADSNRQITDVSMALFEALFEPNAKVLNDLVDEAPYPVVMRDYVSLAYNHLDTVGISTFLTDFRYAAIPPEWYPFTEQDIDGEKVYVYELPMTKILLNGINARGQACYRKEPRKVKIVITVHYYENEKKAFISQILLDNG